MDQEIGTLILEKIAAVSGSGSNMAVEEEVLSFNHFRVKQRRFEAL